MSLFGGLISWKASRQDIVITLTTEAELFGVECTTKETMAMIRLFKEIDLLIEELVTVYCDNTQVIRLVVSANERISTKLRYVDIQNMWLRQEYERGSFDIIYLSTIDMLVDGLTKNLTRQSFEYFRVLLNLQDIRSKIEEVK
jgi:hypothetical protein